MQTLIQVFCNPNTSVSLRKQIAKDPKIENHYLTLTKEKSNSRANGWAKISSTRGAGSLNIEWDGNSHMLYARIVNRGSGSPSMIMADFIEYLFTNYQSLIKTVNIVPIK